MKTRNICALVLIFSISALCLNAQEDVSREVRVVKPYEPVINDAYKISELPKIIDTTKVVPEFDYEIFPIRQKTSFEPNPIKAARLKKEALPKLYYGHIRAGFGSHFTPLAQVHVGSKRSKIWNWYASVNHISSGGKITNSNDKRVYAGYSNTDVSGKVKRFFKNRQQLSIGVNYFNKRNCFYGYNPDSVKGDIRPATLKRADIEHQTINFFKTAANWKTDYLDSAHVNYNIDLSWQTLQGLNKLNENVLKINSNINYFFEKEFVGVDFTLKHYLNNNISDTLRGAIVKFSPWIGAFGDKWRIVAGVHTYYDQTKELYRFYPRVSMHYNIIDYFLIPYFEYDGVYNENGYADIYNQNPFILQNLGVKPTETKMNITFGFRGNISSKIAFNAKANYARITNGYFFVNDTTLIFDEKFNVVYDKLNRVRFLGEISYKINKKLWLSAKTNIFKYDLETELKAWHLPNYTFGIGAGYNIQNKIIVNANIFGVGKRYAKTYDAQKNIVAKELSGVVDLNLGVEYRMSKLFSVFANFNNISSAKYYEWNQYPVQRFNFMVGATYVF